MTQPASRPIALSTDRIATAAVLVTVVLWASAFVGIRAAGTSFSAGSLAFGRLTVGTIALGALVAIRGWQRPSRRDVILIVASGLFWFSFYNVALNEAERNVDAGTAAMLIALGPIFIALLSGVLLGEGLPRRLLAGLAVAFAGAIVIGVATSGAATPGANPTLGVVLCVASAAAYAIGVTLQKPAVRDVPAIQVTCLACAVGAVTCLPFAPGFVQELSSAATQNVAWLVYLGLFPTSVAFTTWAFALRHTPAGRLASTTYLVPPIVIALGWLMLGEVPTPVAIGGGLLCIVGVVIARSRGASLSWPRVRAAASEAGTLDATEP